MGRYEPDVEFQGVSFGTQGASLYFRGDFWDKPENVPLSQCSFEPDPLSEEPGRGTLTVRGWLARKNGWS